MFSFWSRFPSRGRERSCLYDLEKESGFVGWFSYLCIRSMAHFPENSTVGFDTRRSRFLIVSFSRIVERRGWLGRYSFSFSFFFFFFLFTRTAKERKRRSRCTEMESSWLMFAAHLRGDFEDGNRYRRFLVLRWVARGISRRILRTGVSWIIADKHLDELRSGEAVRWEWKAV